MCNLNEDPECILMHAIFGLQENVVIGRDCGEYAIINGQIIYDYWPDFYDNLWAL